MVVFYRDWNESPAPDFNVGSSYLFYLTVEKADDIYPFSVNVTVDDRGSRFLLSGENDSENAKMRRPSSEDIWKQKKQDVLDVINSVINMPEIKNER